MYSERFEHMMSNLGRFNVDQADQSQPELIKLIRGHWIFKPSRKFYNLKEENKTDFSMGQSAVVDKLLKHKVR